LDSFNAPLGVNVAYNAPIVWIFKLLQIKIRMINVLLIG